MGSASDNKKHNILTLELIILPAIFITTYYLYKFIITSICSQLHAFLTGYIDTQQQIDPDQTAPCEGISIYISCLHLIAFVHPWLNPTINFISNFKVEKKFIKQRHGLLLDLN